MSHLAIELISYLRSNNATKLWYDIRNKNSQSSISKRIKNQKHRRHFNFCEHLLTLA